MTGGEGGRKHVRRSHEVGDEARPGPLINIGGLANLDDLAVIEHRDAIGHRQSFALVMGDEDEGDAELLLQRLQLLLHLLPELQVERAERLVEEQHLRVVHQGAGKRHALALAAGKLRRAAPLIAAELDHGERGLGFRLALFLGNALDHEAVGDVLADRHMREEGVVLEHRVDVALVGRNAFRGLAENLDVTFVGLLETGNETQARRLARARRSEHGEELAFSDVEGDAIDGTDRAEVAAAVDEPNGWRHGLGHSGSGPGL
jgi:hypothetical protein